MIDTTTFWIVTVFLALGTFLIRFSFLGILGGHKLPDWLLLHLKYVGVAVFPALVLPLLVWPEANGGETDPVRIVAAIAALGVGIRFGTVWAILTGMGSLYLLQYLTV